MDATAPQEQTIITVQSLADEIRKIIEAHDSAPVCSADDVLTEIYQLCEYAQDVAPEGQDA